MHIEEQMGLQVRNKLGRGSFGIVYECYCPKNKNIYAVKVFYKKDFTKQKLQCFRKESEILESLSHRNIVKFHSFRQTDNCLYLLMEYIAGGTLKQLMRSRRDEGKGFSDEEGAKILKSLLEGIKYLHKIGIIHRDLKPENILMTEAGDLSALKIADFGLSAQVDSSSSKNVKSQCGTLLYMAPEIFFQPSYSKAVDIWSCAVIMYQLLTGVHPIFQEGMTAEQYKENLSTSKFPPLKDSMADNFIQRISQFEYSDRYSVNEALHHPWITRNQYDEVPLSVSESIHSFNTSHLLCDALKFTYFVGKSGKQRWTVDPEYLQKLKVFNISHDEYRSKSPTFRKISKKTTDAIIKIKQIYNEKDKSQKRQELDYEEISSPLIKKHEKLFSRLFQKDRNQEEIKKEILNLQPIQISSLNLKNMEEEETEEIRPESARQERQSEDINQYNELTETMISQKRNSLSSFRNNFGKYSSNTPFDLEKLEHKMPTEKKLRKLNSLRDDGRREENNYFRNSLLKKSSIDFKDSFYKSRSKRGTNKISISVEKTIDLQRSLKKPQTSDSKRSKKQAKDVKPMIFGMGI